MRLNLRQEDLDESEIQTPLGIRTGSGDHGPSNISGYDIVKSWSKYHLPLYVKSRPVLGIPVLVCITGKNPRPRGVKKQNTEEP